jgi:hypothetical protein
MDGWTDGRMDSLPRIFIDLLVTYRLCINL